MDPIIDIGTMVSATMGTTSTLLLDDVKVPDITPRSSKGRRWLIGLAAGIGLTVIGGIAYQTFNKPSNKSGDIDIYNIYNFTTLEEAREYVREELFNYGFSNADEILNMSYEEQVEYMKENNSPEYINLLIPLRCFANNENKANQTNTTTYTEALKAMNGIQ